MYVLDIHGVFLYTDTIMMTKKDYIAIATILNKYSNSEHMILLKLCEYFKKDNPKFNADKFIDMVAGTNDDPRKEYINYECNK